MPSDDFRIYRGRGYPAVQPPERPVAIPRLPRERLTDPAGYKADPNLVEAVNVALYLGQPLLLTGEAGTGKTLLARSLAWELGYPLETYEVKSTSTASDLFYTYNALAQFHVAQLGARRPAPSRLLGSDGPDPDAVERPEQLGLRYLRYNALGAAIVRACPPELVAHLLPPGFDHPGAPVRSVVLLDEIDKAPRDLPNDVLQRPRRDSVHHPRAGQRPRRGRPRSAANPGPDQQLREGAAGPLPATLHLLPHRVPGGSAAPGDRAGAAGRDGPGRWAARRRVEAVRVAAPGEWHAQETGDRRAARLAPDAAAAGRRLGPQPAP